MKSMSLPVRLLAAASVLLFAACGDEAPEPMAPDMPTMAVGSERASEALREVMALHSTVFGARNDAGQLVIGVEHPGVANGIRNVMERFDIAPAGYRIEVTEPIYFASDNLRSVHRPTKGGIQIHFSNYLCTLGFNVDHTGGRSFITNSHCTAQQGSIDGVAYYQPDSGADGTPIAHEVDDPSYTKGGQCSRGKVCRYSDAARALYQTGIDSNGEIAQTTGVNNGSLSVTGTFDITSQDDASTTFSGTVHKVGRTTGWSSGTVAQTCATVNVSGTNIQLLCQTLVENNSAAIVGSGDSGSPVFRPTGSNSAELIGILWGGSGSNLFVFSPLKNIEDELGQVNATTDGTGSGDGGGDDGGDDGGDCIPRGPNGNNCK